ncbi:SDR family NAD(P)-dependent oxidoreductase [Undibacterium squillarum]|uniref:3-oxoacyl-ACP reductase n=1 Tax=Undibacterium squillarum TaxID=1131567 RepID=A0ABQ2XTU7_9BURK|nr:SDR family NAD(P)-dependent oxidoreductase [Undibacterium squillarum]GGX33166.1 3-oxoacyl-ACP reductase [Undibacterium squillarum]
MTGIILHAPAQQNSNRRQQILIIGGTSGIGLAVARCYLAQGHQVSVAGRHPHKVPSALREQYPQLQCLQLDIRDAAAVRDCIAIFSESGLDLLLVSAGMYFNARSQQLTAAQCADMIGINVHGVQYAFEAATQLMLRQGHGQLAVIASVAGLLKADPGASVYSATKRQVIQIADTYRRAYAPFGLQVSTIIPGYINTARLRELNGGDASHKPFLLSEDDAAQRITDGIAKRKAIIAFPRRMIWLIRLLNLLPASLLQFRK